MDVWPDNWQSFTLFCKVRRQWSVGFSGPICLRYEAIYPLLDRIAKDADEWDSLFEDLQTLEDAALEAMSAE